MPSGYVAATVWAIAVILWWTGWRKEMADGLPKAAVAVYLAGWPLLVRLPLTFRLPGNEVTIHAGWLWTAAFAIAAAPGPGRAKQGAACAAGMLLGSIALFADKLTGGAPDLLQAGPLWISAAAVAVVAALLVKSAAEQVVALTAGLALPEAVDALWALHASGRAAIGDPAWADRWWLSLAEVRVLSLAGLALAVWYRKIHWKRGGERS